MLSFSQLDRRIGRSPNMSPPRKEAKVDPVQASLDYLKKELSLDTFQEAAIKTFLEENQKERAYILSIDAVDEVKIDKLRTSNAKMDIQIENILNAKQKEVFGKITAKNNGTNKKTKNKKEIPDELENK
jgi:hypothetical protein